QPNRSEVLLHLARYFGHFRRQHVRKPLAVSPPNNAPCHKVAHDLHEVVPQSCPPRRFHPSQSPTPERLRQTKTPSHSYVYLCVCILPALPLVFIDAVISRRCICPFTALRACK